ncbi:hypothetical protein [Natrinema ejinorense]|uniref:hypothetical protein n=1 Tax=Natrinema ejinorense TaxID=373386 RepID=UPI001473A3B0|nr:hypothetical protein [Natrinema ejinorense]
MTVELERSPSTRATYHFSPALADDPERDDRLFIEVRPVRYPFYAAVPRRDRQRCVLLEREAVPGS